MEPGDQGTTRKWQHLPDLQPPRPTIYKAAASKLRHLQGPYASGELGIADLHFHHAPTFPRPYLWNASDTLCSFPWGRLVQEAVKPPLPYFCQQRVPCTGAILQWHSLAALRPPCTVDEGIYVLVDERICPIRVTAKINRS